MIMRYKEFLFPHNPRRIHIEAGARTAVLHCPFVGAAVQHLGMSPRVITGEGQFFGPRALADYQRLEAVFAQPGSGSLSLPGLPPFQAFFTRLALTCEGDGQIIGYSFIFTERGTMSGEGDYGRFGFNLYR